MVRYMDLMKILNKGWINVIQAIIIIALVVWIVVSSSSGSNTEYSIREDVASLRESVARIEEYNLQSISIVEGLIEANDRIVKGLGDLSEENQRTRELVGELKYDNIEHARRIREVQDTTLESELVTDGVKQIIRRIERDNNYD